MDSLSHCLILFTKRSNFLLNWSQNQQYFSSLFDWWTHYYRGSVQDHIQLVQYSFNFDPLFLCFEYFPNLMQDFNIGCKVILRCNEVSNRFENSFQVGYISVYWHFFYKIQEYIDLLKITYWFTVVHLNYPDYQFFYNTVPAVFWKIIREG